MDLAAGKDIGAVQSDKTVTGPAPSMGRQENPPFSSFAMLREKVKLAKRPMVNRRRFHHLVGILHALPPLPHISKGYSKLYHL